MTDISEILNSEAHDAPAVARRAMEIIRRLEADVDEARSWAAAFRSGAVHNPETAHLRVPWLLDYLHHPVCSVGRGTKTAACPVCHSLPAEQIVAARREFEETP